MKKEWIYYKKDTIIRQLLLHTIKVLITLSLTFTFISIFVWNLSIRELSTDYTKFNKRIDIVQELPLKELIKEWIYER